jgi:glycosyltransferase involved in cell wall biosynthesis
MSLSATVRMEVSVVVATYRRPAGLEALLRGLEGQTLGTARFELIVVDDASPAALAPDPQRLSGRFALTLRVLRQPENCGPAAARNRGWNAARGPLVAFTDDDCVPEPGWLEALLAEARRNPGAILQGRTLPEASDLDPAGLLVHTQRIEAAGPWFETCNIAYPRRLLAELGGFDESFGRRPNGEDTDLGWRALDAGARRVFAPAAVVRHAVEPVGVRGSLRRARGWDPAVRAVAAHPGTRQGLFRRVFWDVWHYLWWRSLLAPLLPRPLRAYVVARHLLALRSRASSGGIRGAGLLWAVPFLWLRDGVESVHVARAALRYRTPLL